MARIILFPPDRAAHTPRVFTRFSEDVPLDFTKVARHDMQAQRKAPLRTAEVVELKDRRIARAALRRQPEEPRAS